MICVPQEVFCAPEVPVAQYQGNPYNTSMAVVVRG